MSVQNAADCESTDLGRITRLPLVGTDASGAKHHFDWNTDTVYVLSPDGDGVAHQEDLAEGDLPTWIDYVADRCGWDDCRYSENGLGATIAGVLGGNRGGDR